MKLSYQFKAFSFTLPVPDRSQGLKEITVDCLSYRRSNPFDNSMYVFTEIDAVWCNGTDIYPLLQSGLIMISDAPGTLVRTAREWGERIFSGIVTPGVMMLPVEMMESMRFKATVTEHVCEALPMQVNYEQIIHCCYVNRIDQSIDIKRYYYVCEPGEILIDGLPAKKGDAELYRMLYDKILVHDCNLREIWSSLDTYNQALGGEIEVRYKKRLATA
jgi:hypothetical protein